MMNGMALSTTYLVLFVVQIVVLQSVSIISTAETTAGPWIIMFSCGYLRVLQNRLLLMQDMKETNNDAFVQIKTLSKLHQQILK